MQPDDEIILRFSKEIIVKFIELGRISPADFETQFHSIFWTIKNTVISAQLSALEDQGLPQDLRGKEETG